MARMKKSSEKGKNKNSAAVEMAAGVKTEIVEKIVEVPVEKIVEKVVTVEVPTGPVTLGSGTITGIDEIDMSQVTNLDKALMGITTQSRQDIAAMASRLKEDIAHSKTMVESQLEAKSEELNDMMESMVAKQDHLDDRHKAAMLVLNKQVGVLNTQLQNQMKISIGLGILLLTSIALGLLI